MFKKTIISLNLTNKQTKQKKTHNQQKKHKKGKRCQITAPKKLYKLKFSLFAHLNNRTPNWFRNKAGILIFFFCTKLADNLLCQS